MIKYTDTVPKWVEPIWTDKGCANPDVIKWSGKKPPPAIGTKVKVTMNSLGPAIVRGYFIEHNWLGINVQFLKPPKWWKEQNKDRILHNGGITKTFGHIFGCEFEELP
jgi:hypothetical protein